MDDSHTAVKPIQYNVNMIFIKGALSGLRQFLATKNSLK